MGADHHDHAGHRHVGGLMGRLRSHRHHHEAQLDRALESSREGLRAVVIGLAGLGATAVAQAGIVAVSGSVALLADTAHNLADALTALPLGLAFVAGRRPPTRRYTYGFGRAEDVAGVLIVAVIAASAVLAGYRSVDRLLDPQPVRHLWLVVAAGLVGFAGNELVAVYRIRVGRRIGSAALVADGLHARTDGFTSLAVVLGALGVLAGFPLADPLAGLLITVAVAVILRDAARQIYRRLMDATDPGLLDAAESALRATPGVQRVDDVRLRWIGHRLRAEAALVVDCELTLVAAHDVAEDARHRLLHDVPRLSDATVHVSPSAHDGRDHHAAVAHHFPDAAHGDNRERDG